MGLRIELALGLGIRLWLCS